MNETKLKTRKPGGGRKRLPPNIAKTKQLTLRLPPDLHEWLKSLKPGSAELILRAAHTESLIV